MIKVSVVILNWNGEELMKKFLPSIVEFTPKDIAEVVVADNGSTDGSVEWLKSTFPEVRIIILDKNYGFTGGYNRALKQIDAKYYVLLNSDVEVKEDYITPLYEMAEADEKVGVLMPKLLSQKEPNKFEYAGACGGFVDSLYFPYCRGRLLGDTEEDMGQYDTPKEIFWASGACFFVRSELYNSLGGLDNDFFAHFEEIDLCWRIQRVGYKIMVNPKARVFHLGGATLDNTSPRKLYFNFRNSLYMIHKNARKERLYGIIICRMIIDGFIAVAYLLKLQPKYFVSVLKAHISYYKNIPKLSTKRQLMSKKVTKKYKFKGVGKGLVILSFIPFVKNSLRSIFSK
ncbi:MAG: glycosyltransferase family 2 protein [Bacteroidetes bacterium]|nr:glycosyltransferase family 2 protein [Bacteroidota bacterium]